MTRDVRRSRRCRSRLLPRPLRRAVGQRRVAAEEDVADVAVVAAVDRRVAGDLGAVRHVVRGRAVQDRLEPRRCRRRGC